MNKRPLAAICIFFTVGILLAACFSSLLKLTHVFIVTSIFILTTVIFLKSLKISKIFLFLSITSLGSLLYLNSNIFPDEHISHFLGKERIKAEIIGIIKSPAETSLTPWHESIAKDYNYRAGQKTQRNSRKDRKEGIRDSKGSH